jgi:hypothetical protein
VQPHYFPAAMKRQGKEEAITMQAKIWWQRNGCGYLKRALVQLQIEIIKE